MRGFGKSILAEVNSLGSKEISNLIFGKDGALGGAGGIISNVLNGKNPFDPKNAAAAVTPTSAPDALNASLTTLQTTGVDPLTSAFTALTDAASGAATSLTNGRKPSGEQSVLNLFGDTTGENYGNEGKRAANDATANVQDFGKSALSAAGGVAQLAAAAGKGNAALSSLPGIVSAIQAVVATLGATSASSSAGSSLGGLVGAIGGLFTGGGTGAVTGAFAQTSLGSSGFGSGLAYGNADLGGFFAAGGRPPMGKASVIGEKGPELFVPDQPGTIVPNDQIKGGQTINVRNNFTINGPTNRATEQQIAARTGEAVRRAMARSG